MSTAVSAAICSNCGSEVNGKYCHECGQKTSVHRLSLHDIFHDVWHALTHTDKGILRLIWDLAVRPRSVYPNYFHGQRKKYFSPVVFFLVTAGALAFLSPYLFDYEDKVRRQYNEYGRVLLHMVKYRALILLPFQAIFTWLFFRKRFNIAEIVVFYLFCIGFTYAVKIVAVPLEFALIWHKSLIDTILTELSYLIIFWHASLVLSNHKWYSIALLFVLVNVFFLLDNLIQYYLIFGIDIFHNNINVHNWADFVWNAYRLW